MSVKSIDGFVVSAIESLKAEWLYSQGKGRHYHTGQQRELCEYLASTCPLTADALDTEDQRKLRLILSKAQHHQQQLKDQSNSPNKPKLQSPRMQSRISRHMGRSPDRLSSSYHSGIPKSGSPSSVMSMSCSGDISGTSQVMSQSLDSPNLLYSMGEKKQDMVNGRETKPVQEPLIKPVNHSLEAASKMVPVPESLMSPDYQDPMYDIQRNISKVTTSNSNASSQSSNSSLKDDNSEKPLRQIVQATVLNRNIKGSPKLTRSAMSSPKLKTKADQRKGSLTKLDAKIIDQDRNKSLNKTNGVSKTNDSHDKSGSDDNEKIAPDRLESIKLASNQRRQKKLNTEVLAAVTIQKMWRGYRSRNLNKDTLRILHAIQAARARQHIQRLTCDMEATKAALESERKIQQLQMQAINALWKKVSTLQASDAHKKTPECEDNTDVLRQLTETCINLQAQVVELRGCMQEVLRAVSSGTQHADAHAAATQTDIVAVDTPQEERSTWLRRPQSLALPAHSAPASAQDPVLEVDVQLEADNSGSVNYVKANEVEDAFNKEASNVYDEKENDSLIAE
ncbi:Centrosomal protein of 97 kDa [Eumeta japonica]|uniref:Centrosomal protein of 97 kDa n=1 Tax=Eumeta variegata TaxID=151549 RepID=A0A4C1YSA0_EUMVA|nr:Centrosomal protein of 97 kDa [Eumeta japonica]